MTSSNRERVGKALEVLHRELLPYVNRHMQSRRGATWAVEFSNGRRLDRRPDIPMLLRAISKYWGEIFSFELNRVHRSLVHELLQVRHDHRHDQEFDSTYTLRTLDSVARLLDGISAKAAASQAWCWYDAMILEVVQERSLGSSNAPGASESRVLNGQTAPSSTAPPFPNISTAASPSPAPRPDESAIRFYEIIGQLLEGLNGGRLLADCNGGMRWPEQAVYFLFEPGEYRSTGESALRVVRVGTHATSDGAKTKLWTRLHMHRGTGAGGGFHRASVFRRHIGAALARRFQGEFPMSTWDQPTPPRGAAERELEAKVERAVSEYVRRMTVVWLSVPGPSFAGNDRDFLERNSVALLSGAAFEQPSAQWLGRDSDKEAIRSSGLWNIDGVRNSVDLDFLDRLEHYLKITV
jgi:hypothetical protein